MKELAADGIPVAVTCRVLQLARQPYYRWLADPITEAELVEAYRTNALFDAHRDDPEFGYRYLVGEAREAGEPMAERTAWRICSQNRLWSVFGKKRGKNGKTGPPVHDDLVERDFTAEASRVSVQVKEIRARAEPLLDGRLDVSRRRRRRQRRHGELLQPAPEERPGPPPLGHPRRVTYRDRHLDRTHLPPAPPPGCPRPVDPDRIRSHHDLTGQSGRVNETVTYPCSRPLRMAESSLSTTSI